MFSSLFGRVPKKDYLAIFDVGSGSVGAALVEYTPGLSPVAHTRPRITFRVPKDVTFDRFRLEMLKAFDVAAEDLLKNLPFETIGDRKNFQFRVVFASPWYLSKTKLLKYEKEEEFTVTVPFMTKLLGNTVKKFKDDMAEEEGMEGAEICEHLIVETSLNGYPTAEPYGKKAQKIHAVLFLSVIPSDVKNHIEEILGKTFHTDETTYHTYALTSFSAVRDLYEDQSDFLIVDVGSEITDILLIRNDVLMETLTFPVGKNQILRALGQTLHTTPEESHSLIRTSLESTLKDGAHTEALNKAGHLWSTEAENTLQELSTDHLLPTRVILSADSDASEWFSALLKDARFKLLTVTHEPFEILTLDGKELGSHLNFKGVFDPFIAVEALALRKQFAQ